MRGVIARSVETRDRYSLSYGWRPSKYVLIEPTYLYQVEREIGGDTEPEHRLRFSVTGILPYKRWTFSGRNLIERRYIEGDASFRYRVRARAEREFIVGGKSLTAYIADEVYYDSRVRAWRLNRIYVGVERELTKRLEFETYYFRQNDGFSRPGDLNVIGTSLGVRLR